jgi:predicted PurR-regulated permease PerM
MNSVTTELRPEKSRVADTVQPDPQPFWRSAQPVFAAGIFLLLFVAFLYLARSLIAPIVAAIIVSIMFGPLAVQASRLRIPNSVFAAIVVGAVLVAMNVGLVMLGGVVSGWAERAPEIAATLKAKAAFFERPIAAWRELQISLATIFGTAADPPKLELSPGTILTQVVEWLTPAVGQLVVFFGMLFFLLLSRNRQRQFLVLKFESQNNRLRVLRILNEIEENLARYVKVVSVVNIGVGAAAALIAFVVGLPNPVLWGVVAGLLNFIPYVGPAIVVVLLFVLGVVSLPTLPAAFLAPAMFVAFTTVEGHLITPGIIGRQLTLSPLATFVSLAFWTWMWGPLGTLLATPFLIAAYVSTNTPWPRTNLISPIEPISGRAWRGLCATGPTGCRASTAIVRRDRAGRDARSRSAYRRS